MPYSIDLIIEKVKRRAGKGKRFSIIVVAEGAKPRGGDVVVQRIVAGRPPLGRRYQLFIPALAAAGRPSQARRMLEEVRSSFSEGERGQFAPLLDMLEAEVLLAEGRPLEAAASYRTALDLSTQGPERRYLEGRLRDSSAQ